MKHVHGEAEGRTIAPVEDCVRVAMRLDDYPSWHPDVVRNVAVLQRGDDGLVERAEATLRVVKGLLRRDFELIVSSTSRGPNQVVFEKLAYDASDEEQFRVTWLFDPTGRGTGIRFEIDGHLDVPRLVPLAGLGDTLAAGFVAGLRETLEPGVEDR